MTLAPALIRRPAQAQVLCVPAKYATVHEAMDAAVDGDCIALGSGTHKLLEPLWITKDVHIIAGDEDSAGATLKLDAKDTFLRCATHMIVASCNSCRISNVTLVHNATVPPGAVETSDAGDELVFVVSCRRGAVILDSCKLVSESHSAVGVAAGLYPTLLRCDVTAEDYAVYVETGENTTVHVECCTVRNAAVGCWLGDGASASIEETTFRNCLIGVEIASSTAAAKVLRSAFRGCGVAGVSVTGAADADTAMWKAVVDGCEFSHEAPPGRAKGEPAGVGPIGVRVTAAGPEIRCCTFARCGLVVQAKSKGVYASNSFADCHARPAVEMKEASHPLLSKNAFCKCTIALEISGPLTQGKYAGNEFERCGTNSAVRGRPPPLRQAHGSDRYTLSSAS
eukprot:gene992-1522_t